MAPKRYTSFSEIDKDLKIHKLRQEIDLESMKLRYLVAKNALYPSRLLGGYSGIISKLLISIIVKRVIKKWS
ncbi:MAG: hypothetical protein KJN76_00740 [Eudoraea sp.]|nr:hypothetical protein [Eudoraea sp.]